MGSVLYLLKWRVQNFGLRCVFLPPIVAQRSNQERYSSKKTSRNQHVTYATHMTMSRNYKPISWRSKNAGRWRFPSKNLFASIRSNLQNAVRPNGALPGTLLIAEAIHS